MTVIGDKIRRARKEKGLTLEQLAEKCGVSPAFIRHIESSYKIPSLPVFISICNAVGASPNYLLEEEFSNPNLKHCEGLLLQLDSLSLSPRQMKVLEAVLDAVIKTTAEDLPKEENTDDRDKAN